MKRLLSLTAAVCLTLPLYAEEKAPEKQEKQRETEAGQKAESPLVAAARRARRGKSTTVVITDDMVKNSTGHLTTTKVDYMPTKFPPAPQTSLPPRLHGSLQLSTVRKVTYSAGPSPCRYIRGFPWRRASSPARPIRKPAVAL